MTRGIALALALLLSGTAFAEDPATRPDEAPQPDDAEFDARIVGVRYAIHLRTGREIEGVVRVRGVFERRVRGVWEECDPEDRDAGIRLWFPARQDGYTYHPISSIERVEERGPVTAEESASIQIARRSARVRASEERVTLRRRREEAARAAAAKAAGEEAEAEDEVEVEETAATERAAAEEAAKTPEQRKDEQRYEDLLVEFPPTDWDLDRPEKIERRRVILGLLPSEQEKAFVAVFDEWRVAYEWWAAKVAAQQGEGVETPETPAPETPAPGTSEQSKSSEQPEQRGKKPGAADAKPRADATAKSASDG